MSASIEELKRVMASKTDEDLCDVLYGHSNDYTAEAVEIARQEFSSRNLDTPTVSNLRTIVEEQRNIEEAHLRWTLRIVAFFVSTAFLGIPVLLAHMHYVEKGSRLKAREWVRWALFGFMFYVAIGVLSRVF